jgi:hypothetical protein
MMAQCGALSVCHDVTLRICKRPLIFHDRPSMLPVAHGLARILERQNMLQISQVFIAWALHRDQAVLPFKDSKGGTWPLELQDFRMTLFWRRASEKAIALY